MTTFADGVFQYGGMPVGGSVPPFVSANSKTFFVDPVNGSDGNDGTAPQRAFASLYRAHYMMTSGNNDVCYLIGNGAASGTARLSLANAIAAQGSSETPATTGVLTWSKNACHLIGIAAPGANSRARIASPTGTYTAATFGSNNFMVVSGNGCYFSNFSLFQTYTTGNAAEICLTVTGHYNVFNNVFMTSMISTQAAAGAAARHLKVMSDENTFVNCQIGADTVLRNTTANASIEFAANATSTFGAARNRFVNCIIPAWSSAAGTLYILGTGAGCVDRWNLFKSCEFISNPKSGTGVIPTVIGSFTSASPGGLIMIRDCALIATTTKWGDTNFLANCYVDDVWGAATAGIDVHPS